MTKGGAQPGKHQARPHGKPARDGHAPKAAAVNLPVKPDDFPKESPAPLFSTYGQPKPEGCWFDEAAAQHAVDFIEGLRHYQGEFVGQPFWLLPWQDRLVRELFGWKNADGSRLYRRVYVECPRKMGKTELAAAIGLYLAYGDDEAGPQVYFAAADKDQAGLAYGAGRIFVEQNPALASQTVIYNSTKKMLLEHNPGGVIHALSSETKKLYGLNLHGLVFDELMAQPNREMWDALTTGQGARRQPLIFAISTAGWNRNSVCYEQHEYAQHISEGEVSDPTFLGVVYGAPEGADWTDEATWRAAAPSLGWTVDVEVYRREAARAQDQPTYQNTFRTLFLSQWVGQEVRFVPMEQWDANKTKLPKSLDGQPCFGGLDLSATTDLTAFVLLFPTDEGVHVKTWFFIPKDGLRERGLRDRVPYETWVDQGHIIATPGNVVDYSIIRETILEAAERYDIKDISFDRWNATHLAQELQLQHVTMVEMGQGFASMSSPTKRLLELVYEKKLHHGGNPVLRWMAENAAAKLDEAGNVKLDKAKSTARIDGIVATVMALDGISRRGPKLLRKSVYED